MSRMSSDIVDAASTRAAFPSGVSCKAVFGDVIRRFALTLSAGSLFGELRSKVAELFDLRETEFSLGYVDEEGDLVTLTSDVELVECLRLLHNSPRILRFTVTTVAPSVPQSTQAAAAETWATSVEPVVASSAPLLALASSTASQASASSVPAPASCNASDASSLSDGATPTGSTVPDKKSLAGLLKEKWVAMRRVWKARKGDAKKQKKEERKNGGGFCKAVEDSAATSVAALKDVWKSIKAQWKGLKKEIRVECKRAKKESKHEKARSSVPSGATFIEEVSKAETLSGAVEPGCVVRKVWRIRNDSQTAWPEGSRVLYVGGRGKASLMPRFNRHRGGDACAAVPACQPGQTVEITINITAPVLPGCYIGIFRMCTQDGEKWGPRLWTKVVVGGEGQQGETGAGAATPHNVCRHGLRNALFSLQAMGFHDRARNTRLLHRHDLCLDRVVQDLLLLQPNAQQPQAQAQQPQPEKSDKPAQDGPVPVQVPLAM